MKSEFDVNILRHGCYSSEEVNKDRTEKIAHLCGERNRLCGNNVADEKQKSDSGGRYKRSRGLHVDRTLRLGRMAEGEVRGIEDESRYCNT